MRGRIIGRIEIQDVYDEGSRARLTAPLTGAITPSVKAVLLFPADGAPAGEGASSDREQP